MKNWVLSILLTAVFLASCAGPAYVRKDAVDQTKRVAIVSVQSNRTLYPVGSGGGGLTALVSMAGKFIGKKSEPGQGQGPDESWMGKVVAYGHDSFARALAEIGEWQVVSGDRVTGTDAYRRFAKNYQGSGVESLVRVAAPGMPSGAVDVRQEKTRRDLAELCKSLGVDGVAVIDMDLGYETSTGIGSIGGGATGTAAASIRATLGVLNAAGEWVLNPNNARSQRRQKSSSTVVVLVGNIAPDDKSLAMFKEGIDNAASAYKAEIVADLRK